MITKELLDIIERIDKKLSEPYDNTKPNKETLLRMIKISEEVWELSWDVLTYMWEARQSKIDNFSKENIKWEFADVIITTLMLAKSMNIDINDAIKTKLKKIKDRGLDY